MTPALCLPPASCRLWIPSALASVHTQKPPRLVATATTLPWAASVPRVTFQRNFPAFVLVAVLVPLTVLHQQPRAVLLKHESVMRWPCPKHFRGHTPARSKSPRASQDCPHLAPLQPPSLLAVLQQGFLWEGAGGDGLPAQVPEPSSPSHLQHPLFRLEHRSPHPLVQV